MVTRRSRCAAVQHGGAYTAERNCKLIFAASASIFFMAEVLQARSFSQRLKHSYGLGDLNESCFCRRSCAYSDTSVTIH